MKNRQSQSFVLKDTIPHPALSTQLKSPNIFLKHISMRFVSIVSAIILSSIFAIAQVPTNQVTNLVIKPVSGVSDIRIDWTNGNGNKRLVIIKDPTGVYTPTNGAASPAASPNFTSGSNLTTGGGIVKCVFDGTGTTVTVSNLTPGTVYRVEVYEYQTTGQLFQTAVAAGNPMWFRTFTTLGDNSWAVPFGINSAYVQTWGAGGGGGGGSANGAADNGGSGGGGGAYAATNGVTVTGTMHAVVGAGGQGGSAGTTIPGNGEFSFFGPTALIGAALVKAEGGTAGANNSTANGGAGGQAANSAGTVKNNAGRGGQGADQSGGAGGSSGAPDADGTGINGQNGGNGAGTVGGSAPTARIGGGTGSDGQNDAVNTTMAQAPSPGGGGGGAQDSNISVGSPGGDGLVLVSYTQPINQDLVFPSSPGTVGGGAAVAIVSSGTSANNIWFAPAGTTTFAVGATMTKAANGVATTINAPANSGTYFLYVVDAAGNSSVASTASLTVDATPPTFTPVAPLTSAFVNTSNVTYNLSENIVAGANSKIVWTKTGGVPADAGSPHTYLLTGAELTQGAHTNIPLASVTLVNGVTYSVLFSGADASGNVGTTTSTTVVYDTSPPSAPGDPTAAAGPDINASEQGTFSIVVPGIAAAGAAVNDVVTLYIGGVSFLTHQLTAPEAAAASYTFTNVTLTGGDGSKSITAKITDAAGNTSAANTTPLVLNLDTASPTAPGNPTAAAGPDINSAEQGTFSIVVPGINTTGAVVNDVLTIYIGGVTFLTHTLTGPEAAAASYTFTNVTLTGGDGSKSITAKVTDVAGNIGAVNASPLVLNLDTNAPSAPGNPTAAAGPNINLAEQGTFSIVVPGINTTGAVVNDVLTLYIGGVTFLTHTLTGPEAAAASYTFTNVTLTGGDGSKSITAKVTDVAGNVGAVNASPLVLNLDTVAPTAPGNPTAAAGPLINAAEQGTFSIVVPGINTTGAVVNDVLTIYIGGVTFLTHTLTGPEAAAASYTFTNVTLTGGDGTKSITAKVTDVAGNVGAANTTPLVLTLDTTLPTATNSPTAAAGPLISLAEENAGFSVVVPLGSSGAVAGDNLTLLLNTSPFPTPINYTLLAGDISATFATLTVSTGQLGADGAKSITAFVTDIAGNVGATSPALALTLDTQAPTLTSAIVSPNFGTAKVGSSIVVTVHAGGNELGLSAGTGSTINGVNVTGSFVSIGGGDYNFTYLVAEGNFDWAANSLPINLLLKDPAGNTSTALTSFAGSSCAGDAHTPNVPSVPDLSPLSDNGPLSTDDYTSINTGLIFSGTADAFTTISLYDGAGFLASTSADALGNWSFGGISLSNGTHNINATSMDAAGNTTVPTANLVVTVDNVAPSVSSIVVNTVATPVNPYSATVNGVTTPPTTTTTFRVTFSENVTGVDFTDFTFSSGGPFVGGGISVSPVSASVYDVSVLGLSGAGTIRINFISNGTVQDFGSNSTVSGFLTSVAVGGNQFFTLALPQPFGAVSTLNFSTSTASTLAVTWPDVLAAQQPTHYLVMLKKTSASFVVPADGGYLADDTDLTDGDLKLNITQGTGSATFNGLASGTIYNMIIYPYTLSPNDIISGDRTSINYFTGTPATVSGATTTAFETTLAGGTGVGTISSLDNTAPQFKAVFQFTIKDDGANPSFDDADFKFTALTLTQDNANGNTIANWSQAFSNANVRLSDNAGHSQTTGVTVNAGSVVIAGIPASTSADLGFIADNATKVYTLEIFLNTSLGGTLPQTIDNSRFVFSVDEFAFAYNDVPTTSSRVKASQVTNSGSANDLVSVVATQLDFIQQPPATAFVLTNLTLTPQLRARDVNGNTDRNFANVLNITNAGGLPMTQNTIGPDFASPNAGVYTFPAGFQYTDDGAGTANNGNLTLSNVLSASSNNVTVTFNNNTRINPGAFTEPLTFSSLLNNSVALNTASNGVFDFTILDDNGAGGDGAPTRVSQIVITPGAGNTIANWTQAIADAFLYDGTSLYGGTVNATDITFTSIPNTNPGDYGYVPDNLSKTYRLVLRLNTVLGGTLRTDIDTRHLAFQVVDTNVTLASISSRILGGENEASGAGNNVVSVISTELRFTNPIGNPTLVNIDIGNLQSVPVVEATDAYGNRDINYSSTTIAVTDNNGRLMTNVPGVSSLNAGLLTFPSNFRFTTISSPAGSTGTLTVASSDLNASSTVPTSAIAGAFEVKVGTATTISAGAAAPATISSLVNASPGVPAFNFNINDDFGAALTNNDGVPTIITDLRVVASPSNTISDWTQVIAGAILTDGTNSQVASSILTNQIQFLTMNTATLGLVPDGATKNYTLRIWLKNPITGGFASTVDGLAFGFQLTSPSDVILSTSTAVPSTKIIAAETANSGSADVVTVVATSLRFISTGGASATVNQPYQPVVVEAVDANNNRDLNFTGAGFPVALVYNNTSPTGANMTNQPAPGTQFNTPSPGLLTFAGGTLPGAFNFSSGVQGDDVTLKIAAGPGPGTTCGVNGIICGTSPTITLQASFESSLVVDPTFVFPPTIDYHKWQEATDISGAATTTATDLARFLLVDGDRTALGTQGNAPSDATSNGDDDGAQTKLASVTFRITNPSAIRRITLFSGPTELLTTDVDATALGILPSDPFHDFTFNGAPTLLSAADNSQAPLTVRVSFRNTAAEVRDRDLIRITLVGATLTPGGSSFFANASGTAGVVGGAQAPVGLNVLNITATKLDFMTQPGPIAGYNTPFAGGTLEAHDPFGLLDTDFVAPATVSAGVPVSFSGNFSGGKINLAGMLYGDAGVGTPLVTAGGIASNMNNTIPVPSGTLPNVSAATNHVDVIHVSTSIATGGVITSTNLIGGTNGKVIYGVTFRAGLNATNYNVTSPAKAPLLNGFTISFSNSTAGVFTGYKVYESVDNIYVTGAETDVTTFGVPAVLTATATDLKIDFGSAPRDLTAGPLTYFLQVDVLSTASGTTPSIQPDVVDDGTDLSPSTQHIVTSSGVANAPGSGGSHTSAGVAGQTYTFASIFPPLLTSSNPFSGQLNVDPAQNVISLTFSVPVWTLDGVIKLYDQTAGNTVVTCTALNAQYLGGSGALASTVNFSIPTGLIANHLYYVNIAPGNLSALTGLMDQANNLFQGFTFSGTLYFKVSNPVAPVLLGANTSPVKNISLVDPSVNNISLRGATINATFDQQGTAYYLVVKAGSPVPTNAQIKNYLAAPAYPAPANVGGTGTFQIVQTNGISQFGIINPINGPSPGQFFPSQGYAVYMYAENNAQPTPISTLAPYGSGPGFVAGGSGPTLTFSTPASSPAGITLNAPGLNATSAVRVCNSSFQAFNAPIVINEGSATNFSAGVVAPTPVPTVTMNIGLPAGFQFDVSKTAGVPNYGTLTLVGSDFIGTGTLGYLGNSILTISYKNNGGASVDKIIISNLRVIATGSSSGSLFRIGGTALTSAIPDGTSMGSILSFDAPVITFDNSYSKTALGNTTNNVVTSIPDNADDLDNTTVPGTIQLTPVNPNAFDFGPNSFSGQGVNINVLSLSAVSPDVPFNISIIHTDNNGCISTNPIQYTIYDHTTAVNLANTAPPAPTVPPVSLAGGFVKGPFTIINDKFVNSNQAINPFNAATSGLDVKYAAFNNLVGYYLQSIPNPVPANASLPAPTVTPPAIKAKIPSNAPSTQIIYGPDWATIIASLPVRVGGGAAGSYQFLPGATSPITENFSFDMATILNASAVFPATIKDPYQNFRSSATAQGNYYHTGGSLGIIEITGNFQSATNSTVVVPRTQIVELFVPAVPLVEIGLANRSFLDVADPKNPVGKDPLDYPAHAKPQVSNPGTPVFCTAGGLIVINGYPAALVGSSKGKFKLTQATDTTQVIADPYGGFVDNGNGTATIDPTKLNNGYADILIQYTYKENAAPKPSRAAQIIRITPNPLANFTFSTSPLTPYVRDGLAQCEDQAIKFISTSTIPTLQIGSSSTTTPPDPTASITNWSWNFGDVSSSTNLVSGNLASGANQPSHVFNSPSGLGSPYVVQLTATSNYGCASVPSIPTWPAVPAVSDLAKNIDIGGIPVVKFKMDGVSTSDVFRFNSNDTQVAFPSSGSFTTNSPANNTTVSGNDFIAKYVWSFGDVANTTKTLTRPADASNDAAFNNLVTTYQYTTADIGPRQVNLTVTSNLGCVNSLALQNSYRSIVVLPRAVLPVGGVYVEDFEAGSANWQVWGTGTTIADISAGTASASWAYGTTPPNLTANTTVPVDPNQLLISKAKIWKTSLTGNYNPGEKSALYSPSFDLTNLTRPMVSFNSIMQIERSDGVVLEYSKDDLNIADPNKKWFSLGVIGDGEDWFTDQGIAGRPGTQTANDFGWSGSSIPTWQSPKHILDPMYTSGPPPTKAIFRLAMGSAAPIVTKQGFSFDNFRVGDRTRTILLENFANAGNTNPEEAIQNKAIAQYISGSIGTEVVKVNYHVSFPGRDPLNEDNPGDPSSRALFYNIVTTPRSRLDGEGDPSGKDQLFKDWVPAVYNLRTLQLAQADITVTPTTKPDGSVSISVSVLSSVLTGIPSKTILHVAVLEQSIALTSLSSAQQALVKSGETSFDMTLKKMLPTAAGTQFGAVLPFGQTRNFGPFVWNPDPKKLYQPQGDLAVAVFLQQEDAPYEVYQVEYIKNLPDPPVVTGLEPVSAEDVRVYPVPANHEMHVVMPGILADTAPLELIDQTGRTALQSAISAGESRKTLNVSDLASGVYILQINVGNGNFTRKKVMVVHDGN